MTSRYAAQSTAFDGQRLVQLTDHGSGRQARIARHGAALVGFDATVHGVCRHLVDGYRDGADIVSRPGSRFAIMVPFAGRIADARYSFAGESHDLQPGVVGAARAARHGFVRAVEFDLAELTADDRGACVTLSTQAIRPQPGDPHAIDLSVRFTLDADGLTLEARMRNVGTGAAPCFFGWHPYFRLADGAIDGWELQIPAQTAIRTGDDLIPLAGDAAYLALDDVPELDFRQPQCIGGRILDQGYTHLQPDADGRIRTHLRDPASGLGIAVWQQRGVLHAFTADTVSRPRQSVALEPMECMADAFNRPECAAAILLPAGAERSFCCGVEVCLP